MLTTDVRPGTNLVTIEYSGALNADEMVACRAVLERVQEEHGTLRLLARYGEVDMTHIEPRAMWEDLKNIPLIRHVEKCAIVAHQDWLRTISDVAGRVLPCEVKTFHLDEYDAALTWVTS
ncbi:SpoIIAA family protein [Mobilicoccus massiliensis]|uniref:STAS/SEC14 domain-containing protein n=1 Tax=Mobilicoccus massiliensis TaxID=1522310 RepID=UPI00058F1B55|nr:STAS/SEC14 domain-containing protein [Mobilicoccus massiliensis]